MFLRKTGSDEIMLNLFLSYILMRTRGPYDCSFILENIGRVFIFIYVILVFWALPPCSRYAVGFS